MPTEIDHLDEDRPIVGQEWICVSFLSPEGIMNCSLRGFKFRGAFPSYERAKLHADKLQKEDPNFHVFVGEGFKWLPWDPDPNSVEDNVYQNKKLNEIMQAHKDNLDKKRVMEAERKQDMIQNAARNEVMSKNARRKDRMRRKLEEKKKQQVSKTEINMDVLNDFDITKMDIPSEIPKVKEDLKREEAEISEKQELAKSEKKRLDSIENEINNRKSDQKTLEQKMSKIEELIKRMNK